MRIKGSSDSSKECGYLVESLAKKWHLGNLLKRIEARAIISKKCDENLAAF